MTTTDTGYVELIDRDAASGAEIHGQLLAHANDGRDGPFVAQWIGETPPPPLSRVLLLNEGGEHTVLGTLGARRERVLHDDFTIVESVFGYGDTGWRALGTVGTINTSTTIDAAGHVRIRGNPTSGQEVWLAKTDENVRLPADGRAMWLSARFLVQQITNVRYRIGFANDLAANDVTPGIASGVGTYLSFDTARSSSFELITTVGTGVSNLVLPVAPVGSEFVNVDLVIVNDQACVWIDGDGPHRITSTANVPTSSSTSFEPFLYVEALEAVAKILIVDRVDVEIYEAERLALAA